MTTKTDRAHGGILALSFHACLRAHRNPVVVLIGILAVGTTAHAGGWPLHRHEEKPHPTPDPGPARHICHTHERAGLPLLLRDHVEPTNAGDSYGYYVGGGGGHHASARCPRQGTYGWDYTGIHFPRQVILGWRGRHQQNGAPYYNSKDPVEVPNVFAAEPLKALHYPH